MPLKIALLGWGSLLWDRSESFDPRHGPWEFDGPSIQLEFSRVSTSRGGALTLIIDEEHGSCCHVAYAISKRALPDDSIADLRCREETTLANIGYYFRDGSRKQGRSEESIRKIAAWSAQKAIDVVIWADLERNFCEKSSVKREFSIPNAIAHIQGLPSDVKAKAAEYVWRAPKFVSTPLRAALEAEPWFSKGQ